MSKVVLHIGTHKTATTTIQDLFWTNSALLAQHGLVYPRLSTNSWISGHHGLVHDWSNLPPVYKLAEGSQKALARIATEHGAGDATVFLSSEEFSRGDPSGAVDFARVRELLAPFDEIEVICVLRPQWQFLQSVYVEVTKARAPARPPLVVERAIKTGMFAGLWADYTRLLDRLEEVFAPEEITLIDFETACQGDGGIVDHMLTHLGVELKATDLETINDGRSNVSPMPLACWAANLMFEPARAPDWLIGEAVAAFQAEFGAQLKPCLFSREEFNQLKSHFGPLNDTLRERRAPYQPDFALRPPDANTLNLYRNAIRTSYWVRLSRRLAARAARNEK